MKLRHELDLRNVEIKNQEHLDTEREQALALAAERLSSAFSQRANEQLQSHSETFLKLAKESLGIHLERAKAELASREQAVENLVKPIRDVLNRTEAHISSMEKTRHEAHGSIRRNWRPWRSARRRSALRHAIWLTRSDALRCVVSGERLRCGVWSNSPAWWSTATSSHRVTRVLMFVARFYEEKQWPTPPNKEAVRIKEGPPELLSF